MSIARKSIVKKWVGVETLRRLRRVMRATEFPKRMGTWGTGGGSCGCIVGTAYGKWAPVVNRANNPADRIRRGIADTAGMEIYHHCAKEPTGGRDAQAVKSIKRLIGKEIKRREAGGLECGGRRKHTPLGWWV